MVKETSNGIGCKLRSEVILGRRRSIVVFLLGVAFATPLSASDRCDQHLLLDGTLAPLEAVVNPELQPPAPIAEITCDDLVREALNPESFARTTFWGKVSSSMLARMTSSGGRLSTHPASLTGDLIMVFASPWIKQRVRNGHYRAGGNFGVHTVLTLAPRRLLANGYVSVLDSALAYATSRIDHPELSNEDALAFGYRRLEANLFSYVILDSFSTGLDDFLILEKLIPKLSASMCRWVSNGKVAAWLSRGAVVLGYSGLGFSWEKLHYELLRNRVFGARDASK